MKNFRNYRRREKEKHILGEDVLYEEKTLLRHNRISALRIFIILMACLLALLVLYFCVKLIFRVESITVEGNLMYSVEDVIAECGIEQGDLIFSFPSSRVKKLLSEALPFVESVEIKREYPSTVHITLTEYESRFMVCQHDKYILISPDLKVLKVADSNIWGDAVITLGIPEISRALEGSKLEFADLKDASYITGFITAMDELSLAQKIDIVELSDIFSVKMICEGRYTVSFGKYSGYDTLCIQMRSLSKVMSSDTVVNSPAASIDVSDPKQTSVIPYDSAEDLQ